MSATTKNKKHQRGDLVVSENSIGRVVGETLSGALVIETVMTKEVFLEAYRKWVLDENE